MAVIGRAEIEVVANVANFERQLNSQVQKAASKTSAQVPITVPNVDRAERSLRSYALMQERAIKENEAFNLAQKRSAGFVGQFSKAVDAGDESLKDFGLSMRDLTQFARVAGPALAAVAVGKFAADAVQSAANLGEAINLTRVTFGESADEVLRFGENAASAIGQSERAALSAAGQIGQLGKSFGLTEALAAKLGITLTKVATDITSLRNVEGGTERVTQAIESAFAGQSEPLLRLGVDTRQAALEQIALRRNIIEVGEELTNTTRIAAVLAAVQEDANDAFGDFANTADTLPNRIRAFGASVEELKASLGERLLPAAEDTAKGANQLVDVFGFLSDKINQGVDKLGILGDRLQQIPFGNPTKMFGFLGIAAEKVFGIFRDGEKETDDLSASIDDLISGISKLPPTFEQLAEMPERIEGIRDEIDKITDARERYADAIVEAEERVDDAEKRLIQTIEDNEKRVDDAEKNLAKTRIDGARDAAEAQKDLVETVRDANESLIEAQEQREEAITDAQERLAEVRLDAEKQRAAAREALEEGRLDVKKRIADAEERLEDARRQRLEAIFNATLGVEEAQARGDALAENRARRALGQAQLDRSVKEAAEDLLEAQKQGARDITELEQDLAEVRIETRNDIKEAEEELAETIQEQNENVADAIEEANERIAESRERLHDLEISLNERLLEAEERLSEAREEQAERVAEAQKDRLKALDESNEKVAEAREKLTEAAGATGDWAERLKVLNDQLERLNLLLAEFGRSGGDTNDRSAFFNIGQNATGGAARAGTWSTVGEEGIELVKWGSNATVVSNEQVMEGLRQLMSGGAASGTVVNQHIVSNQADARVLANELTFRLMQGVVS